MILYNIKKKQECLSEIFSGHHLTANLKENQLAILTCRKSTTETQKHDNLCLENKITADNYGRIIIKSHKKIKHLLLQRETFAMSNKFVIIDKDKHFKIECSVIEDTSVNQASRVVIESCRLLKKMQHLGFHIGFD